MWTENYKANRRKKGLFNKSPKAQTRKKKVDCFHDIKIKGFRPTKDTIDRVNREVAEWKKTFATPKPNKRLTSSYLRKTNKWTGKRKKKEEEQQKNGLWLWVGSFHKREI